MGTNREIIEVKVTGTKKAKKQLGNVSGALSGMASKVGVAAGAFFGARGLINGFKALVTEGSKLQTAGQAFDNMGKKIGFTSQSLNKLRQATNNTISDIDLMTKANNAMALSIVNSDEEMAELFDTSQRLGEALGVDTARALDSLVTGMGRQSKLMLDNLGIMVDAEVAYQTYADELGIVDRALDDNEKKIAFNNEAMRQARDLVNQMGSESNTSKRKMEQLNATFSNMTADLGKALSPALENLTSKFVVAGMAVADFMRQQTEDETQTAIRNLKEMGVDTRELELSYTRLQQNKVMQQLGNQSVEAAKNTERITEANKEIEDLERQKLTHAQQSLDLRERIMKATGGEMSLATLSTANQIQANAMYGVQSDKKRVNELKELQAEEKLFKEKQLNFDNQIDMLNTEVKDRQGLIDLRIRENALIEQNTTNLKEEGSALNNVTDAVEKQGSWQRKLNAIKGEGKKQTLEGARTEYQSALSGAKAHLIAQIMKMRFPLNLLLAAGAESAVDN